MFLRAKLHLLFHLELTPLRIIINTQVSSSIRSLDAAQLIFKMKYVFSYVCLAHAASGLFFAHYLALVVFNVISQINHLIL